MAVLSKEIYSPQSYIEAVTGRYYCFGIDTTIFEEIQSLLSLHGFENLRSYPLNEIEHIVENKINVVLVDVSDVDEESGDWLPEYRWFEVPNHYHNEDENENI